MPLLTTVGMILGGASAIKGFMGGGRMASAGRRQLNQLRDVELKNAYANLNPSIRGEELMFAQTNRRMGQIADVASGMDAASAMGLINASQGNINEVELQGINSILDKDFQADTLRAQDEVRIQGQLLERNQARRNEAISQINAGEQMQQSALEGAASMAIAAGNAQEMAAAQGGFDDVKSMRAYNKAQRNAGGNSVTIPPTTPPPTPPSKVVTNAPTQLSANSPFKTLFDFNNPGSLFPNRGVVPGGTAGGNVFRALNYNLNVTGGPNSLFPRRNVVPGGTAGGNIFRFINPLGKNFGDKSLF